MTQIIMYNMPSFVQRKKKGLYGISVMFYFMESIVFFVEASNFNGDVYQQGIQVQRWKYLLYLPMPTQYAFNRGIQVRL